MQYTHYQYHEGWNWSLLVEAIKRALLYHSKIIKGKSSITKDALEFESRNNISPNFPSFAKQFYLNTPGFLHKSKDRVKKTCHKMYDDYYKKPKSNILHNI